MVNAKKWYQSKTMWFNLGVGLVAVGNEMLPLLDLIEGDSQDTLRLLLVGASSIGNTILRSVTSKGITR